MIRLLTFFLLLTAAQLSGQSIYWITDCAEKTFCLNQGSCTEGAVFMVEKAETTCNNHNISYSYKIDLDNNGPYDISSSEDTVTGNFNVGTHRITWRASDPCGDIAQCTYLFHIKDCTPPNLVCISGLTQTTDLPNCSVTFSASQFIQNLTDNCTPDSLLQIGLRRQGAGSGFPDTDTVTFDKCEPGTHFLEVWAKDANGLTNQCSNYVIVQTGDPECSCVQDGDLHFSSCARAANGLKMSTWQPRVTLLSTAGVQPPVNQVKFIATTDSCSTLTFPDVPFGGDYRAVVRAYRPDSPLNGVTTYDMVLVSKHILGIEPFISAYQLEAADVNNSNSVSTFDIVETRKLLLNIYDTLPAVPAWRLARPLPDPSILGSFTALVDTYTVNILNLQADSTFSGYNFVGIKYGDVNYSASFKGNDPADDRTPLLFSTPDRQLQPGEETQIAFRISDPADLNGWQLALSANPDLLEFESVEGLPDENYFMTPSGLRALWFDGQDRKFEKGQMIFSLKIKALQPLRLSEALFFDTKALHAEAYRSLPDGSNTRSELLLHFDHESGSSGFYGVSPNPFDKETTFRLYTTEPASARLELFAPDGKQVLARDYDLGAGLQSIQLRTDELSTETILLYRLEVNGTAYTGKLVRD